MWRTYQSSIYSFSEYSLLTTYKCKHKVTGRPICAIPCDGIPEMCEDDIDEQCEGPGITLVLLFTFILAVLFFAISVTSEHLTEARERATENIEMEEYNMDAWYLSNLWINLHLYKHSIDYKKARIFARKYYDNFAVLNNRLCPKDEYFMKYLGTNKLSEFFYDCIDGAISVRIICFFDETAQTFSQQIKKYRFDILWKSCLCVISLALKYSDLPKDCLLLYIIWIQLVTTDSGMFSISVFWTLSSSILASELMHLFTILVNLKDVKGRCIIRRRFILILTFPIMPAIYIFKLFREKLLLSSLLNELSKSDKNKRKAHFKMKQLEYKICNLHLISTKLHCNENVVENLVQLVISVIFVFLSYSNSKTVENIDYLFMNKNIYITFTLASLSLMSIIRGHVNILKANKNGCLGIKGIIITIPYFLVSTTARYIFLFLICIQHLSAKFTGYLPSYFCSHHPLDCLTHYIMGGLLHFLPVMARESLTFQLMAQK